MNITNCLSSLPHRMMHFELDGAGLIPSEEDQPHHPPQPIHEHPINKHLLRPEMVLKTLSRSDPHLNFTGHLHHEDDRPLTQAVFGLLEASSGHSDHLHFMSNHPANPIISSLKGSGLTNSASSAALLDPSVQNQGAPLRKSSSAVDWSLLADVGNEKDAFHQLVERPGAFLEGARKKPTNHFGFSALALLGTHKDEGLVMNTPSSSSTHSEPHSRVGMFSGLTGSHTHAASPLVAAASACLHGSSSSSKMGTVVPSTSSAVSNPLQPSASTPAIQLKNPLEAANQSAVGGPQEHKHGMLGSVFNRGFLGRPIQRTDEENYRYIMALDR
ncbi:hypothetical protein PRIPAC_95622 [Pristionchus pacificus]|uniref:Uncharacterized protein n=1 Tax=Pristionchus pacificus TaxID=54126 RepID=A0A2A6D129_PRIPA|nr:hypothetical protein PRIPAC_95622 [Pristionchus pacificus]|eukprot:PDM83991.1 hypothetical protein PRIPAC_34183 [Pristionchus pacificus]